MTSPDPMFRQRYRPTYHPDGRKVYDPQRTEMDIHDEWEAFEEQLRADGETCPLTIHMRSREMWRQEEERKERWSEWQQRVWYPRMRALAEAKPRKVEFTKEELERLVEHFAGANDPVAQSILAKALAGIGNG